MAQESEKTAERVGKRKLEVAKKMFKSDELCERCGSKNHSTKEHGKRKPSQEFKPQDKFTAKDERKEKKEQKEKGGNNFDN